MASVKRSQGQLPELFENVLFCARMFNFVSSEVALSSPRATLMLVTDVGDEMCSLQF